MPFHILIRPHAQRALRKLPRDMQGRIASAIDALAQNPRPAGCEKLRGSENLWRIREGDYRVIYQIRDEQLTILVLEAGHRREIYRRQ